MKCFQFEIKGHWAHFKRPETSNTPLTHDMITKTALIGMIGAVLGIERQDMKEQFPLLSEDLLYNVQLLSPVKKVPIGQTIWRAIRFEYTRKSFEVLKEPAYLVTLALKDCRSTSIYEAFKRSLITDEAIYPPVMGWHNCPAELKYVSDGLLSDIELQGIYSTKGFVLAQDFKPELDSNLKIGFDKLPTYQNNDFWNDPEKYAQIVYPDVDCQLTGEGKYRIYETANTEEKLCLI